MNLKLKPVLLTSVVAISMLLNACTSIQSDNSTAQTTWSTPTISSVASSTSESVSNLPLQGHKTLDRNSIKTTPTIRIDWSRIDTKPSVPINNIPKYTKFSGDIPYLAKQNNISEAEQYRREVISYSINSTGLLDKIKQQLKDSYVNEYWQRDQDSSKLIIVTRQDVMAETHEYVFNSGKAKGFSLPIVILPIADRSEADMRAIYEDEENIDKIRQILAKKGATLTTIGYTPDGFKIYLNVRYSSNKLTPSDFLQLENEISTLLGVNVKIERRSVSVSPL